ncbi:MAG: hypothetical protein LCI03_16315 [Actinobacteria bacterium]|nr:hypothetical protein [Actinomycetota bacterium]
MADQWEQDLVVLRARPFGSMGTVPLVFLGVLVVGTIAGGSFRIFFAIMLAGVAGVLALLWWRTRSWTLALSKAGLERRTSAWRVRIPWSAVERLRRDSNGLLGSSWTIEHEQRTIEGPDGGEPTTKALEDAALRKAGSRLLLDAWTRDPRSAPLGTYLRQHRPDLL